MNHFLLLLIFLTSFSSAHAQQPLSVGSTQRQQLIENAAKIFADAFATGDTSKIKQILGPNDAVIIETEHSICDDCRTPSIKLKGAGDVIQWIGSLSRKDQGEPPWAGVRKDHSCEKTICRFESSILHNHIYLDELHFNFDKNNKPYVSKVKLLNG